MEKIQVMLIEDNRLLREAIASLLEKQQDFEVIAQAEDGESVQRLKTMKKNPDVVLLDLGLQKENSLHLMGLLKREFPEMKIIPMGIFPEEVDIVELVKAGGSGFLLKDASFDDLLKTIRKVVQGEKVLPPVLVNSLFFQIVNYAINSSEIDFQEPARLTSREREIVDLISEGLSNKEIAQRLHIATYTVKSHVHNILEKLALRTRLQIAYFVHKKRSQNTDSDTMPLSNP